MAACRAVREGLPYDEALVRDIFSRSGFTDGYFTGKNDGAMFGVRTEADAERSHLAAPRAREQSRAFFLQRAHRPECRRRCRGKFCLEYDLPWL